MRLLPTLVLALTVGVPTSVPLVGIAGAAAQTKPMTSGHQAHFAPQMRRHGSGLHYPNRPHHHHFPGLHGYRPTHGHHHRHHHSHFWHHF